MTRRHLEPASLPPESLTGLSPSWSRLVTAPDHRGDERTWHLLDHTGGDQPANEAPRLTILCVHGNPSWSYLWRNVVANAPDNVRVIAVDQLDMGYSERTGVARRLANRIDDLCALTDTLAIDGPVVTIAHDWGGPVSLGWAQRHLDQLAGVVLTNTAVHQPAGSPAPAIIRATRLPVMLQRVTVSTPAFVHGAIEMARPRINPRARAGLLAPYKTAERRQAIATFVEDIPLDSAHPTAETLAAVADNLAELRGTPTLLLWGPSDPVFSDLYLHDLHARLPHAKVHRFVGASHFVSEQADVVGALYRWIDSPEFTGHLPRRAADPQVRPGLNATLDDLASSERAAVVELSSTSNGTKRQLQTFAELAQRVDAVAKGLTEHGVCRGDRVAVLIAPGIDLNTVVYACWQMGAVMVLVDAGLGPRNMSKALHSANPDWIIGIDKALLAARTMRWPGRRIAVSPALGRPGRLRGAETDLETLVSDAGSVTEPTPDTPQPHELAAVVFTSGSTGPSKGVVYTHGQVQAQRDSLASLYAITTNDRLVAAFAPFALYGPALGITTVVPDMDITKPATLTAKGLAEAVAEVDATLIFASPAALENVHLTSDELSADDHRAFANVRLVLSAGAPVPLAALQACADLFPNAQPHTPYGMTEALPVANISLADRLAVGASPHNIGVCVGQPAPGVIVTIDPLDHQGVPAGQPASTPNVLGEIIVAAAHQKQSYDNLWYTEAQSRTSDGHHRTGDIGSIDSAGRLWVAGRLQHVVATAGGPVAPVGIEQAVEQHNDVARAAVVGIGPVGAQVVAVVVELADSPKSRPTLPTGLGLKVADAALATQVRAAAQSLPGLDGTIDIAAVLTASKIPTDRRHNSKVDRTKVAREADLVLAGS